MGVISHEGSLPTGAVHPSGNDRHVINAMRLVKRNGLLSMKDPPRAAVAPPCVPWPLVKFPICEHGIIVPKSVIL